MGNTSFVGASDERKRQKEMKDSPEVVLGKFDNSHAGPYSVIAEVIRKRDHDVDSLLYRTKIEGLRQDPKARNRGNSMVFAGQNSAALLKSEGLCPTLMTMTAPNIFTLAFHEFDGPTVIAEFKKNRGEPPLFSFVNSDASSVAITNPETRRIEKVNDWLAAQSLGDSLLIIPEPGAGMKLYRLTEGGRNEISIARLEPAENVRHSADLNDQKAFNRLMLKDLPLLDVKDAPAGVEGYAVSTDKYLIVTDIKGFPTLISDLINKSYLSGLLNKTFTISAVSSEKATYFDDFPEIDGNLTKIVMKAMGDGDERSAPRTKEPRATPKAKKGEAGRMEDGAKAWIPARQEEVKLLVRTERGDPICYEETNKVLRITLPPCSFTTKDAIRAVEAEFGDSFNKRIDFNTGPDMQSFASKKQVLSDYNGVSGVTSITVRGDHRDPQEFTMPISASRADRYCFGCASVNITTNECDEGSSGLSEFRDGSSVPDVINKKHVAELKSRFLDLVVGLVGAEAVEQVSVSSVLKGMSPDEAAGSYGTLQKVEGIHKVKMRFDRYGDAYAARDRNVEDTLYTVTNASGDLCMVSEGCGLDTVSRRVGGKLDPAGLQALVEELRVF